jgi:hypothetical protein
MELYYQSKREQAESKQYWETQKELQAQYKSGCMITDD